MSFFSDLGDSNTLPGKIVFAVFFLAIFAFLGVVCFSSYILYGILAPPHGTFASDATKVLGNPDEISFTVSGVGVRKGWFFPGLTTAPTIVLCHGYGSSRGELLTMVTALQEHRYNVFVFDFSGHGTSNKLSTLGYRETKELIAAINTLARRDDIDRTRFGVWGANMGGYAAIAAASLDQRIHAIAVDSVYDDPKVFMQLHSESSSMGLPLVARLVRFGFHALNFSSRNEPPLSAKVSRLAGVAKLFIIATENPVLAENTRQFFIGAPEPRQQFVVQKASYTTMLDDEKRQYESQVVSFFLLNLPPTGAPATPAAPAPPAKAKKK